RCYLIRHGQIAGYDRFPVYGHTDVEMTEVGILQMEKLSERLRLARISAVYSSDLMRSVQGARIIARHHDVPLNPLPELREMYFGDWEGKTLEEIRESHADALERREADMVRFRPPGNGESVAGLAERILPPFKKILEEQKGGEILFVGHGMVNRILLSDALGLDLSRIFSFQQDYGCLNIIDYFADRTVLKLLNG
ncbi:MAG: histidine phosphatase family protein, partial [Pseudomonadota bacterium]